MIDGVGGLVGSHYVILGVLTIAYSSQIPGECLMTMFPRLQGCSLGDTMWECTV